MYIVYFTSILVQIKDLVSIY